MNKTVYLVTSSGKLKTITDDLTKKGENISFIDGIYETWEKFYEQTKTYAENIFQENELDKAQTLSLRLTTINNAKNHIAITSMANSVMINQFTLYAIVAKEQNIEVAKLMSALDELQRCQAMYVKTNAYDTFDAIALQDLVDIYNLMPDTTKAHIKDNLEIYSWFEAKAPFMEFYKKIGGVVDNA